VKRILYIEDNATVQLIVKRQLAKLGEVSAAGDLKEGRLLLRERSFDLLLSDLYLPDGEAFELVFEIRRQHSPEQFPVILVSASMDQLARAKSFRLGANDCFAMPTPWPVLLGAVERMLARPYVGSAEVNGVSATYVEGRIDSRFWLFCPEFNLFLEGDNPEGLRDTLAQRVKADTAAGTGLPFVRNVRVSEHLIKTVPQHQ